MKNYLNELGQTTIEYLLMIVVVTSLAMGVFKKVEEAFFDGPNGIQKLYLKNFSDVFSGSNGSFEGMYKHFIIRK